MESQLRNVSYGKPARESQLENASNGKQFLECKIKRTILRLRIKDTSKGEPDRGEPAKERQLKRSTFLKQVEAHQFGRASHGKLARESQL